MAVFTAIASAIVTAIGVSTATIIGSLTWAGLATSIIAGGLAVGTAKVLGVFKPPAIQQSKDPGVKIQLPPATDNKVPVMYGKVITGGVIVDAGISNQNDTMTYVLLISEETDTGTFSVSRIYRGDQTLNFGSGASAHIVQSVTDTNATASNKVQGKMRCRVYAGGTSSSNQIFPTGVGVTPVAATTMLSTITGSTNYSGLVYAIFQIDYDPEENLVGLDNVQFEIENSLKEPSNVLLDYLRNDRYGAKLTNADLDLTSFNDLYDYSTDQVAYRSSANVSLTHDRWQIDGMLSTYASVKDNIDALSQSCASFFTYNPKEGKFAVVPNRVATTAEKSAAFVFNDDNIVSSITITSPELYSFYNSIEAEYPNLTQKDQTDVVIIDTPAGDRNPNEPDNKIDARYDLVNDNTRVHNLANIDLRQSRTSTVLEFDADYSAIQVDVGDVVKVTQSTYGYSDKLFRVMRVVEQEDPAGMLTVKVLLLEYSDDVYAHSDIRSEGEVGVSGIPGWWTGIWGNIDIGNISNIVNGNVTIIDDPLGGNANIVDPPTGNIIGNINIGDIDDIVYPPFTPPGGPIINVPITVPEIPDITTICTNLYNQKIAGTLPANVDFGHICVDHVPPDGNATFPPRGNVTVPIPVPEPPVIDPTNPTLPIIPDYEFDLDIWFSGPGGNKTTPVTIPSIPVHYGGGTSRASVGQVQAGLQEEQTLANYAMANSDVSSVPIGSPGSLIVPSEFISLGGIDEGTFTATNNLVPFGGSQSDGLIAYKALRTVYYKEYDVDATTGKYTPNGNADLSDQFQGSGYVYSFSDQAPPPSLVDNFEYEISSGRGSTVAVSNGRPPASSTKAYVGNVLAITHLANSNLTNIGVRGAQTTNQDKRIARGDDYIDLR